MTDGRSMQLYFVDGRPDGMLTAEVFGWTGQILKFPRLQINDALKRPEVAHTGAYILLGPIDGQETAYIGESESVKTRLLDHEIKKDWWEQAIVITSANNSLHKAHAQFLEARLIEIANDIKQTPLENKNNPKKPSLSEADISNMEGFLAVLNMVLPAIRVDMFMQKKRGKPEQPSATDPANQPLFVLHAKKAAISATAIVENGEFIVQAGSDAQDKWVGEHKTNYHKLQSDLISSRVIIPKGKIGEFSQDYAFSSPSAAAAVVLGRSANGRTEWKVKATGQTYKDWETKTLDKEDPQK